MAPNRLIPAREHRTEIRVVNSRFITSIAPAFSVEEARAFITKIRNGFSDASHNVPAFIIGHGQSITEHCHDDGEPSGTAGRPMLAVFRGSGLGDAVVVVTRYFGGTKLGKGGLVRAYGDSVKAGLEGLTIARKVATHTIMVAVPYPLFERTRLLAADANGFIIDEDFAGDVTLTIRFAVDDLLNFQTRMTELSHGQIMAEIIESNDDTILPLPKSNS